MSINRRSFLKGTVAAAMTLSVPNIISAGKNKTYRTALIGSGWWGMNICRVALQSGKCKIVAMCDVDRNQLDPAAGDSPGSIGSSFWAGVGRASP